MTYEEFISNVVKVVEATGAAILVFGGLWALARLRRSNDRSRPRVSVRIKASARTSGG